MRVVIIANGHGPRPLLALPARPGRAGRANAAILAALALLGTAGAFVFGDLAGEGGKYYLRNIVLGVACSVLPITVTAVNRITAKRLLRAETGARELAVAERERALQSKAEAERQTAEVRINAEARLIFALRARLSPSLYCLGKIAASASDRQVPPLIGSLSQAIVSAAIEHGNFAETPAERLLRGPGRPHVLRQLCGL
jgi:hypothetical protein